VDEIEMKTTSSIVLILSLLVISCGDDGPPGTEIALLKTSFGTIEMSFHPAQAPLAVENFKGLIRRGYYDGVTFHRVIRDFMIQGGDPTGTGFGGESIWGEPFPDEFDESLRFDRPGRVAMANSGPDTNGSQFFITLVGTPHLNDRHTIFASVIAGMDVVEAIAGVETDPRDLPVDPVMIELASIVKR
jgi:peptidylprolyl isomerase